MLLVLSVAGIRWFELIHRTAHTILFGDFVSFVQIFHLGLELTHGKFCLAKANLIQVFLVLIKAGDPIFVVFRKAVLGVRRCERVGAKHARRAKRELISRP